METYRKVFFWIFMILGVAWAIHNKEHINLFFSQLELLVNHLTSSILSGIPEPLKGRLGLFQILVALVMIVIMIIIGLVGVLAYVVFFVLKVICWILAKLYIGYAIIGIIFIYPFYVVFINLFELFLLLMIKHPSRNEIRRVIGRGRIDGATIDMISGKMMDSSGKLPHELESQIMTKQLKVLNRFIHVEIAAIKKLREAKIREAMMA